MMTLDSGGVELIEVINTELSVRLSSLQDVVDNDQEAVCDRDYGFVGATTPSDSVKLRVEVSGVLFDARPGDLAHDRPTTPTCSDDGSIGACAIGTPHPSRGTSRLLCTSNVKSQSRERTATPAPSRGAGAHIARKRTPVGFARPVV